MLNSESCMEKVKRLDVERVYALFLKEGGNLQSFMDICDFFDEVVNLKKKCTYPVPAILTRNTNAS